VRCRAQQDTLGVGCKIIHSDLPTIWMSIRPIPPFKVSGRAKGTSVQVYGLCTLRAFQEPIKPLLDGTLTRFGSGTRESILGHEHVE
jgi:hypothetical protein